MLKPRDRILVVDVEATCWDTPNPPAGQSNEIIEIGVVELKLAKSGTATVWVAADSAAWLVTPHSDISPFCTDLTHITPDMIRTSGTHLTSALAAMSKRFRPDGLVWASYGDYDRNQFRRETERKRLSYPFSQTHLNIKALASLYFGWGQEVGTAEAARNLNLVMEGQQHRALADALNISNILLQILNARP